MSGNLELGHIGVLLGGPSSEREISFKSGKAILQALQAKGCRATAVEVQSESETELLGKLQSLGIDLAFIALHGAFGEDGTVQEILERQGIPFTGSGPQASRLAMDKIETQKCLGKAGVPIPEYLYLRAGEAVTPQEICARLRGFPLVVKPAAQGSSIGVTIVTEAGQLNPALNAAFQYGDRVLVEAFIAGKELTCGILGDQALPVVEIRPRKPFFDFTAKYEQGATEYIVPAQISEADARAVQHWAREAFLRVGCRDLARIDFILSGTQGPFCLEINTIPGFTGTSLLPMAARQSGLAFGDLCLRIASLAAQRGKKQLSKR